MDVIHFTHLTLHWNPPKSSSAAIYTLSSDVMLHAFRKTCNCLWIRSINSDTNNTLGAKPFWMWRFHMSMDILGAPLIPNILPPPARRCGCCGGDPRSTWLRGTNYLSTHQNLPRKFCTVLFPIVLETELSVATHSLVHTIQGTFIWGRHVLVFPLHGLGVRLWIRRWGGRGCALHRSGHSRVGVP